MLKESITPVINRFFIIVLFISSGNPESGDIYEQAFVKSVTGRQRDFSKHLFGIIL